MLIMAPPDRDQPVGLEGLPAEIQNVSPGQDVSGMEALMALPLRESREAFETQYMRVQLARFDGNVSRMAGFVGMERSALHRKLKSLDVVMEPRDPEGDGSDNS